MAGIDKGVKCFIVLCFYNKQEGSYKCRNSINKNMLAFVTETIGKRSERSMTNYEGEQSNDLRVWEIDFVRAVAIMFMVAFHFLWDLQQFTELDLIYWDSVEKISNGAVVFMFISAISSGFSREPFKRGLMVFGVGLGVSVVTYFIFPDTYVRFGILHFLGVAMMLFPLLKRLNNIVLLGLAVVSVILGFVFTDLRFSNGLLLPFGIRYNGYNSVDYYPLFPYLAASILGVIAYKKWYYKKKSLFPFYWSPFWIQWISRHALVIYLVHQPIILGILFIFV